MINVIKPTIHTIGRHAITAASFGLLQYLYFMVIFILNRIAR